MTEKIANKEKNKVSRRNFLKGGAILGAAVGLSSVAGGKTTENVAKGMGIKELDTFPYQIADDYVRYDQKALTFSRLMVQEPTMMKLLEGAPGYLKYIDDERPGYSTLDFALNMGAASVENDFASGSAAANPKTPLYTWDAKPVDNKYEFSSIEDATKVIKKAARFYGADLVGITPYDEKWVYDPIWQFGSPDGVPKDLTEKDFPFKPKSVIVMAFEEDYEGFATAPSQIAEAAAMLIYSKMAETNYKLSSFIRQLGYKAFGSGNDTAMSVPYAIAAGLGEQGRQGLLVTYEYGPRVRICKVFTELNLVYDNPIEFGANKFCQVCKKCATTCPSKSISLEDEMTWEGKPYSMSNQVGVRKYYVNVDTCFKYWNTSGNACGVCIAACPYNKPDFWHHRITTALTGTPLKPFLNEMDDLFGYGNVFDEQSCVDFWGIETYAGKKY